MFTIRQEWPGVSLRKIAELLNGEGYTTRGKAFTPVQVKCVLDREDLYRAICHYAGLSSRGQHEAIIA